MWARKFVRCIKCGTTKVRHIARGFCANCYQKDIEKRHKDHPRGLRIAAKKLTKQYLIEQYIRQKKSPTDIAKVCGCTREYVYKKMREHGLPLRSKRSARRIALQNGKIIVKRTNDTGEIHSVIYQKIEYNEKFFASWFQEMAYVLGILYTDGCLSMSIHHGKNVTRRTPIISFAQKERELIAKVLALMDCNAKIHHHKRRIYGGRVCGAVYYFSIACYAIYPDLVRLGLKSTKSLDIEFPTIPQLYVRHFIRGCWDGDGSVYFEKRNPSNIKASFVSGSSPFINGMLSKLEKTGLPKRKVYIKQGKKPSYYFRFTGSQCIKLYHYLYDDVSPTQYLERKHASFKKYADKQEKSKKRRNGDKEKWRQK